MAFREYATKEDICRHLCQHKVGDIVTLRKNCKTDTGVCERGTELEIRAITIREGVQLPSIYKDKLHQYYADAAAFSYELIVPNTEIQMVCTGNKIDTSYSSIDALFHGIILLIITVFVLFVTITDLSNCTLYKEKIVRVCIAGFLAFYALIKIISISINESSYNLIWEKNTLYGKFKCAMIVNQSSKLQPKSRQ